MPGHWQGLNYAVVHVMLTISVCWRWSKLWLGSLISIYSPDHCYLLSRISLDFQVIQELRFLPSFDARWFICGPQVCHWWGREHRIMSKKLYVWGLETLLPISIGQNSVTQSQTFCKRVWKWFLGVPHIFPLSSWTHIYCVSFWHFAKMVSAWML